MPVQRCEEDGKPGFKWGSGGACYTFTPGNTKSMAEARMKAETQGVAVAMSRAKKAGRPGKPTKKDFA